MADNRVQVEDLMPVQSRVSWGAVLAGAVVALALHFVLTLLGGAIGFTVSDDVSGESLGRGAAIWAVVATVAALFFGGWITSQCTVGENKMEAVVHGIIMWGVVFAMILWLLSSGLSAGFSAMAGMANLTGAAAKNMSSEDWEAAARQAGVSQESIDQWRQSAEDAPERAREEATDPANREAAAEYATQATWWTLGGTLLSMAAAVIGAVVGAGPSFRIFATRRGVAAVRHA
ncbi:MAG: hypothetical protein H0T51_06085 [Pirellulales bacterium]|nr:hypothetical protein [Pirellulales bacterium]